MSASTEHADPLTGDDRRAIATLTCNALNEALCDFRLLNGSTSKKETHVGVAQGATLELRVDDDTNDRYLVIASLDIDDTVFTGDADALFEVVLNTLQMVFDGKRFAEHRESDGNDDWMMYPVYEDEVLRACGYHQQSFDITLSNTEIRIPHGMDVETVADLLPHADPDFRGETTVQVNEETDHQ